MSNWILDLEEGTNELLGKIQDDDFRSFFRKKIKTVHKNKQKKNGSEDTRYGQYGEGSAFETERSRKIQQQRLDYYSKASFLVPCLYLETPRHC